MYLLYEDISGASAPFVVSLAVGLRLPRLGSTLRRWVLASIHHWASPLVVGLHPSSLGFTLRSWALASAVGLHPYRWASPFAVGSYPSSLCVKPFAVGFNPAGAITFVWFGTKATGAKGAGLNTRVVRHEGGFVLVGAKAAV